MSEEAMKSASWTQTANSSARHEVLNMDELSCTWRSRHSSRSLQQLLPPAGYPIPLGIRSQQQPSRADGPPFLVFAAAVVTS